MRAVAVSKDPWTHIAHGIAAAAVVSGLVGQLVESLPKLRASFLLQHVFRPVAFTSACRLAITLYETS